MFTVRTIGMFFLTVIVTMVGIYIIKAVAGKYNIPVLSTVAEGV